MIHNCWATEKKVQTKRNVLLPPLYHNAMYVAMEETADKECSVRLSLMVTAKLQSKNAILPSPTSSQLLNSCSRKSEGSK